MKKALVLILTVILLMSLAAPAFAVASPTKTPNALVTSDGCTCGMVLWRDRFSLSAPKLAAFEEAKKCLEEAVPEGYACRDLVYFKMEDDCTTCDVEIILAGENEAAAEDADIEWIRANGEKTCGAWEVTLSNEGVNEILVMQYLNGEWVEKEMEVTDEHTVALGMIDGPVALLTK